MRQCIPLAVVLAGLGCGSRPSPPPPTPAPVPVVSRFDPSTAGGVRGRVMWAGPVPGVSMLPAAVPNGAGYTFGSRPNPFAPQVSDGGLGGVVVWLPNVPADRCKPWPYPPATVEQTGHALRIRQGDAPPAGVGFARVGEPVTVVSNDPGPATIRLRGAAFVTMPFPGPDRPTVRRFDAPGVVEVTSGTMLTWAAADLVVCDHPYHAVTAADGRFSLDGVPPGEYEVRCRVRNWTEVGHDRDPETGLVSRRRFGPPVVRASRVTVPERGHVEHTFRLSAGAVADR